MTTRTWIALSALLCASIATARGARVEADNRERPGSGLTIFEVVFRWDNPIADTELDLADILRLRPPFAEDRRDAVSMGETASEFPDLPDTPGLDLPPDLPRPRDGNGRERPRERWDRERWQEEDVAPTVTTTQARFLLFRSENPGRRYPMTIEGGVVGGLPVAWFPRATEVHDHMLSWNEIEVTARQPRVRRPASLPRSPGAHADALPSSVRRDDELRHVRQGNRADRFLYTEAALEYASPIQVSPHAPEDEARRLPRELWPFTLVNHSDHELLDLYVMPDPRDRRRHFAHIEKLERGGSVTLDFASADDPGTSDEGVVWLGCEEGSSRRALTVEAHLVGHLAARLEAAGIGGHEAHLTAATALHPGLVGARGRKALWRIPEAKHHRRSPLMINPRPEHMHRVALGLVADLHTRTADYLCRIVATGRNEERQRAHDVLLGLGERVLPTLHERIRSARGAGKRHLQKLRQEIRGQ